MIEAPTTGSEPGPLTSPMTAAAAAIFFFARVAHAVIKTGTEYRPFVERTDTRWKDPSLWSREGAAATL